MNLIKRAEDLGFEIRLVGRGCVWLKYQLKKDAYWVRTFNSLYEFEAFIEGFNLAERVFKPEEKPQLQ